jgi:hypothetical protein
MVSESLPISPKRRERRRLSPPYWCRRGLAKELGQKKIAILRPAAQQEESAALAESYGFSPILAPAIALAEKPLPKDLVERLCKAECVAFTSANGGD